MLPHIAARRGKRRAAVAVADSLLKIAYYLLRRAVPRLYCRTDRIGPCAGR